MSTHPKGDVQKPTVLTDEVQRKIRELLRAGNYLETACRAAGISKITFYRWKKLTKEGDPSAFRFRPFFEGCERDQALAEVESVGEVRSGRAGWQGPAWVLERRNPERWGRKDRAPEPPKPSKPLKDMTDEELAAHERDLAAGKP